MEQIKEKAFAKLNLGLDVIGKREDGYHLVSMVMQQIEIFDEIAVYKTADEDISLEIDFGGVHLAQPLSSGEDNLCVKAARCMNRRIGRKGGYFIHLSKRIPIAAGMAGGSSDAAAVLRAVNRLEGSPFSMEELKEIGVQIGADIPYCIEGGTMLAEGIGEKLTRLSFPGDYEVLIAKPPEGCSTGEIYSGYDHEIEPFRPDIRGLVDSIESGNKEAFLAKLGNALAPVAKRLLPQIDEIEKIMKSEGASAAIMTGSGPTVFGLFEDREVMEKAALRLRECGICETVATTRFHR